MVIQPILLPVSPILFNITRQNPLFFAGSLPKTLPLQNEVIQLLEYGCTPDRFGRTPDRFHRSPPGEHGEIRFAQKSKKPR